jgi:hypothetical protein
MAAGLQQAVRQQHLAAVAANRGCPSQQVPRVDGLPLLPLLMAGLLQVISLQAAE